MGDEVRVTVIATGFDPVAASGSSFSEAKDAAIYAQQTKPQAPSSHLSTPENLEVPTFLRRQAD
jgi:cell division GTPase FtsZ